MNENPDDAKLEAFLRQFRPQQPRPLPGRTKVALLRWRVPMMTAAAAVFVLSIALIFFSRKHTPAVQTERTEPLAQETSFIRLSRAAMDDPREFDARMDSLSAKLLPDVRRSQGILKALAHE